MKNKEKIIEEFRKKYGKDYEIEANPENYIHEGLDNSQFLSHLVEDIDHAIDRVRQEERERIKKHKK